jgi:hypothetical protein
MVEALEKINLCLESVHLDIKKDVEIAEGYKEGYLKANEFSQELVQELLRELNKKGGRV